MKRSSKVILAAFVAFALVSSKAPIARVYAEPAQQAALDNRADAAAQTQTAQAVDPDRTQELLMIWKEHVKTLTQERDEAYKQIEALKNQAPAAPPAQENNAPAMTDAEKEAANRTIADLKSQIQSLQSENEQLKAAQPRDVATVDQDLKMELSTLREENQKLKLAAKENTEAQSDKEVILREKEDALRQLDALKGKMTALQKKYDDLQAAPGVPAENTAVAAPMAALQAKAEKLKVVETELQEARDYFASYMKELDAKNKKLTDENNALKARLGAA